MQRSGLTNRVLVFSLVTGLLVLLFSRVLMPVHAAADFFKAGFVDMQKVFDTHLKSRQKFREVDQMLKEKQAELDKMGEELQKLKDELRDSANVLAEDERNSRRLEYDKKLADYEAFYKKTNKELKVLEDGLNKDVLGDIKSAIDNVGAREGFSVIISKQNLLFGADSFDLTEKVIAELAKTQ